jgi:hypothetical protein
LLLDALISTKDHKPPGIHALNVTNSRKVLKKEQTQSFDGVHTLDNSIDKAGVGEIRRPDGLRFATDGRINQVDMVEGLW